jgi:hypothetical protein
LPDLNALLRAAEAAEQGGFPDIANNYREQYQQFVSSGVVPGSDGKLYPIPGALAARQQQQTATAAGQRAGEDPLVDVTITDPNTGLRYDTKIPRSRFDALQQGQPGGGDGTPSPGGATPLLGKPYMTPEESRTSAAYGDQAQEIINAAKNAPDVLGKVAVLRAAAAQFADSSFGGFGPTAQDRINMANKFADVINQLGGQVSPGLSNMIASGQIIGKEQGQLASLLVRQLGSREAAQIYLATRDYQTPGVTMSRGGYDAIVNSLEQGAQRDVDLAKFQDAWLADPAHGRSIAGMMTAFNQAHPIETYASKVVPIPTAFAKGRYIDGATYQNPAGRRAVFHNGQMMPVQ